MGFKPVPVGGLSLRQSYRMGFLFRVEETFAITTIFQTHLNLFYKPQVSRSHASIELSLFRINMTRAHIHQITFIAT